MDQFYFQEDGFETMFWTNTSSSMSLGTSLEIGTAEHSITAVNAGDANVRKIEFFGNNSYYNDQDLYREPCLFNPYLPCFEYPANKWTYEDFSEELNEIDDAMLVNLYQQPQKPLIDPSLDEYSAHPMPTDFPVIPSNSNNYNGGWACEELGRVVNEMDQGMLVNPPNMSLSTSCFDHQTAWITSDGTWNEINKKRRRRPSVRFVDLINKKKLSVGDKLHYKRRKENKELGAGMVTEMGIQCCCCDTIYSMSKFEQHTVSKVNGKASHRPHTHIYLGNGKSLENLQMEILGTMYY